MNSSAPQLNLNRERSNVVLLEREIIIIDSKWLYQLPQVAAEALNKLARGRAEGIKELLDDMVFVQ
jgi:hypothetical protein